MAVVQIILASGSPRRQELLREMGVSFEVRVAEVTELEGGLTDALSPVELALANARLKAEAVAGTYPERWVLGADTVVYLMRRIDRLTATEGITSSAERLVKTRMFGKPRGMEEAREFLHALSGWTHEVVTGCVLLGPGGEDETMHEVSRVTFRELSDADITRYLAAVDVLDKAGAYALQENGEWIVAEVEGSRTNVIGLPMEKVGALLRTNGLAE